MRLGWVDFSREARKRAMEALAALSGPGAVDELGFGTLRDAFADAFFPGTSTLQTRAKYFVLVPCAIRYALEHGMSLRQVELECCRQMCTVSGPLANKSGIIGSLSLDKGSGWIQRPPSEVYWAGMRKLGILRSPLPPGLWFDRARRLVDDAKDGKPGKEWQEGVSDDPDTAFSGWKGDFDFPWKTLYCGFRTQWDQQSLSPNLTPLEAKFLRERILRADGTRGTLFAWCLESRGRIPPADNAPDNDAPSVEAQSPFFRFAQSIRHDVPKETRQLLDAAIALNRLVFPAHVLHNCILGAHPDAADIWQTIKGEVPIWAKMVDLPTLFALFPGRIPPPLEKFLQKLRNAFLRGNTAEAEVLVKQREIAVKPGRAKVLHPEKLESGKWVGGGWLDYRLKSAGRILRDIAAAKGGPDA